MSLFWSSFSSTQPYIVFGFDEFRARPAGHSANTCYAVYALVMAGVRALGRPTQRFA